MPTVDEVMAQMGFAATERGPNVTALREVVARQISEGLRYRSMGTWAPEHGPGGMLLPAEERARSFLEVDWEIRNAHSYEVKSFDGPIQRTFSTKTMRRSWRFRADLVVPWIGDRCREAMMQLRVWRDRHLLRKRNPYRSSPQ